MGEEPHADALPDSEQAAIDLRVRAREPRAAARVELLQEGVADHRVVLLVALAHQDVVQGVTLHLQVCFYFHHTLVV